MHKKGFYHSKTYILKLIISIQHFCFKYPVKNEFIKILIVRSDAIYIKFWRGFVYLLTNTPPYFITRRRNYEPICQKLTTFIFILIMHVENLFYISFYLSWGGGPYCLQLFSIKSVYIIVFNTLAQKNEKHVNV